MKTIPVRQIVVKEQSHPGRFSIRRLEQVLNGKDLLHDLHRHNFYYILALKKGAGMHEIDFVEYKVQDHAVFLLRPGQVHKLTLKAGSAGLLMEFDRAFYPAGNTGNDQYRKKAIHKNYCAPGTARFSKLYAALMNIYDEFNTKQQGYITAIKASLDLFFIAYIRQSSDPASVAATTNSYAQERFEELLHLLEANIATMKNVSQYAGLLNLSSYQLNAITKSAAGKTVSELINEQILLEAKRHLLATSSQVKDIADQLGYEDASYFTRFFKKHTGQSPEAFRRNFT